MHAEALSQAVKLLKYKYLLQAINQHKMDQVRTHDSSTVARRRPFWQAIIFCRTKVDCDNLEQYLLALGGSNPMANEFSSACVHSDRSVDQRRDNLQKFKARVLAVKYHA